MLLLYRLYVFTNHIVVVYIVLYISVQSEEEYSLIWKVKPVTIQTDKGKW